MRRKLYTRHRRLAVPVQGWRPCWDLFPVWEPFTTASSRRVSCTSSFLPSSCTWRIALTSLDGVSPRGFSTWFSTPTPRPRLACSASRCRITLGSTLYCTDLDSELLLTRQRPQPEPPR